MIIRSALRLRHGRIALPKLHPFAQHQHRANSSLESTPPADSSIDATPLTTPQFVSSSEAAPELAAVNASRAVAINDPNHPVALDYAFFNHQKTRLNPIGTSLSPHYRPHELLSNPPSPADITLELLIASQTHIGHATSLWHPANSRYIFGVRDGIHIIAPDTTASHLRRACKIVSGVTERGGLVLFVGTREGQARAVVKAAQLAKGCHLFTKWIPGSITNGQQILGRCAKKVVDEHDKEVEGFEDQLGAKAAIKPDLVVCLNPLENYVLLHECGLNNIPTIGICDTDANPTWVTYPIPANDDSLRAVQVIAGVLGRAGEQGQANRARAARDGVVSYMPRHGLAEPTKRSARKPSSRGHISKPDVVASPEFEQSAEESEADQKLLNEADDVLFGSSGRNAPDQAAQQEEMLLAEEEGEESGMDAASETEDLNSVDPSLTDEKYSIPAEDAYDESEDLAQFGESAADESENTKASTIDQVDDVVKELGEDQVEKKK